jgi:hypothetical protein
MKENFTIITGTPDYDENVDELNIFYVKQQYAFGLILIGGILILVALL